MPYIFPKKNEWTNLICLLWKAKEQTKQFFGESTVHNSAFDFIWPLLKKAFPSSASPAPSFIAQDATTASAFESTSQDPFINKHGLCGCHIDAPDQQRALNFKLVVSDQLFSVILVAYN